MKQLPDELVKIICSHLTLRDLSILSTTCKQIRAQCINVARRLSTRFALVGPCVLDLEKNTMTPLFVPYQVVQQPFAAFADGDTPISMDQHYIQDKCYAYVLAHFVLPSTNVAPCAACMDLSTQKIQWIANMSKYVVDTYFSCLNITQDERHVYFPLLAGKKLIILAMDKLDGTVQLLPELTSESYEQTTVHVITVPPNFVIIELQARTKAQGIIFVVAKEKSFKVVNKLFSPILYSMSCRFTGDDGGFVRRFNSSFIYVDARPTAPNQFRFVMYKPMSLIDDPAHHYTITGVVSLHIDYTLLGRGHYTFSGIDSTQRHGFIVNLQTGEGTKLACADAYYLVEHFVTNQLLGTMAIKTDKNPCIDFYASCTSTVSKWSCKLPSTVTFKYTPQVQVACMQQVIVTLLCGDQGCYLFGTDLQNGALLWHHNLLTKQETQFSHFDVHPRMTCVASHGDDKHSGQVQVILTVKSYGFKLFSVQVATGTLLQQHTKQWDTWYAALDDNLVELQQVQESTVATPTTTSIPTPASSTKNNTCVIC